MNRIVRLIILAISILIGFAVAIAIGYQYLDPYSRDEMIALIPFDLLFGIISTFLFIIFNNLIYGSSGISFLTGRAVKPKDINVHFSDVIGLDEAVSEAREIVGLVKDRIQTNTSGGHIIRGLLMLGPPGCGKTLLAKAIATEAGLPFLALSGSDFVEKWYSMGASRIRMLFKEARRLAENRGACIIFIDELEVIGQRRDFSSLQGESETNRTLTQLLVEMDGLSESKLANIIVIGATNAPEDVLDKALLRPGRFDRKLMVDLPRREGRADIFEHFLGKVKGKHDIDFDALACMSAGSSPSDIENIIREAALLAAKKNLEHIDFPTLIEAMEKLRFGLRAGYDLSDKERQQLAVHEAGHLLMARLLRPLNPIVKVSIEPRRRKFSVVHQIPVEERHGQFAHELMEQIEIEVAGLVAEKMIFTKASQIIAEDMETATHIAKNMVTRLGMTAGEILGSYGVYHNELLADSFKSSLNNAAEKLITQAQRNVEVKMQNHRSQLEGLAKVLVDKGELDRAEIEQSFQAVGL